MDRHYEDIFDKAISGACSIGLRVVGWLVLILALSLAVQTWGWSYGMVMWVGMLSLAGLIFIWWVSYQSMMALKAGVFCAIGALLLMML